MFKVNILPNSGNAGTVCIKEAKQYNRLMPMYGTVLMIVDAISDDGNGDTSCVINRQLNLEDVNRVCGRNFKELRLILEVSLVFRSPSIDEIDEISGRDMTLDSFTWDYMMDYLQPNQEFVRGLLPSGTYNISVDRVFLPNLTVANAVRKFTRWGRSSSASFVVKAYAKDVKLGHAFTTTEEISVPAARERLLGYGGVRDLENSLALAA